jgi:uncharacterized repeat protein (TIGR03803 family)
MLGANRTILRPVFSHCGTLLTALLIFTTHSAQAGSPALTVIHNFGISDGADPLAGLAMSHSKVLYGSTSAGGTAGDGVVFSLTPPAAPGDSWTEQVLYNIGSSPGDGVTPYGGVAIGAGGVVYGTTFTGGTGTCSIPFDSTGCGTVFSLTPPASPGGAWTEQVLYSFSNGTDGRYPVAGVAIGKGGVLYGTTGNGGNGQNGSCNCGTVFSLTPPATPGGSWTEEVLYNFGTSLNDGSIAGGPNALVIGKGGVLYGTTDRGGTLTWGSVFSLTPPTTPGGSWTESVLYSFENLPTDGAFPQAGLVIGSGGTLYGTTAQGGTSGKGTVFSLEPSASPGGPWTENVLYSFGASPSDGNTLTGGVVIGRGGVIYGTTQSGGRSDAGTVFSLTPPAVPGGAWTEVVLHNFTNRRGSGENPTAGVLIGSGDVLYGTTSGGGAKSAGTVFKLKP